MLSFEIPIEPVAQGRPRFGKGFAYTPGPSRKFKRDFRLLAKKHLPGMPLEGALLMTIVFALKRPKKPKASVPIVRPDIDNYVKAILDAMNPDDGWSGFWLDDSQVVGLSARKVYAVGAPSVTVVVSHYTNEDARHCNNSSEYRGQCLATENDQTLGICT
jgi:Holliday junction resolvase RusA-like endonuclease